MSNDTESSDCDCPQCSDLEGAELRDRIVDELGEAVAGISLYAYRDEDGDLTASSGRFLMDDDLDKTELLAVGHIMEKGMSMLASEMSIDAQPASPFAGAVAMTAEEAEEAGILDMLREMGEEIPEPDENDEDDRRGFA